MFEQEARARFRQTLSDSSSTLNSLLKKHKKSIEKSKTYYHKLGLAKKVTYPLLIFFVIISLCCIMMYGYGMHTLDYCFN